MHGIYLKRYGHIHHDQRGHGDLNLDNIVRIS